MILAAAVQMTSGADKAKNIETAAALVRRAAKAGATFVGLPENFGWMGPEPERNTAAEPLDGPSFEAMSELARDAKVTLLAGSLLETGAPGGRLYNTSTVFGPDGSRLAVYRKMHLFDVEIGDGQTYRESAAVAPGEGPVVAETPVGKVGLTVCYDLRFPELYRACSSKGATILTVPAAFTLMTGKDHWEVLLRARAIENLCHVVAPAQWGLHPKDRRTYGHAMIVDPWGLVIARASEGEGFALGPIDAELTARVRKSLPALQHRRL